MIRVCLKRSAEVGWIRLLNQYSVRSVRYCTEPLANLRKHMETICYLISEPLFAVWILWWYPFMQIRKIGEKNNCIGENICEWRVLETLLCTRKNMMCAEPEKPSTWLKQEVRLGCHFIWWCGENGDQNLMYRKWNDVVEAAANLNHWMNTDGRLFSINRKLCRIECILPNLKLKPTEIGTVNTDENLFW